MTTQSSGPLRRSIPFADINRAALANIGAIVTRWFPGAKLVGHEWHCRNPKRNDRHFGSFKVNNNTGKWGDFATGDGGGDVVSLAAWLFSISQAEAARRVGQMIGMRLDDR